MNQIDLTVLVPTYNRARFLPSIARALQASLGQQNSVSWELLISDNCSPGGVCIDELRRFVPGVRVIQPATHLPTAEENLFFALDHANGRFVWLLGDDDNINPHVLEDMLARVVEGDFDLLIYNSAGIDNNGYPITPARILCLQDQLPIPLLDFVRITGFWFVIAGFSTTILRRQCLQPDVAKTLLKISKIYSHVIYLIACFHGKRFCFVNKPLVAYRQNLWDVVSTNHWQRLAEREKTALNYPWTLGFVKLLKHLENEAIIDRTFAGSVLDQDLVRRLRWIHIAARLLLDQLAKNPSLPKPLRMSGRDASEVLDYLESAAPDQRELWRQIRDFVEMPLRYPVLRMARSFRREARTILGLLDATADKPFALAFFAGFEAGCAVYKTPWGTFRIPPDRFDSFVQTMRFIDGGTLFSTGACGADAVPGGNGEMTLLPSAGVNWIDGFVAGHRADRSPPRRRKPSKMVALAMKGRDALRAIHYLVQWSGETRAEQESELTNRRKHPRP